MKDLLMKAEEEIGDTLANLQTSLSKYGFKIDQIYLNPYGRRIDSDPPGYGYYLPGVRVVIQRN
jgi:hypothetical protein